MRTGDHKLAVRAALTCHGFTPLDGKPRADTHTLVARADVIHKAQKQNTIVGSLCDLLGCAQRTGEGHLALRARVRLVRQLKRQLHMGLVIQRLVVLSE